MLIRISDNQGEEDFVRLKQPVTLPIRQQDGYNANIVLTMRTILCEFSLRTKKVEPN